ncbi:MAG: asparaginase [Burkholderiales bacterium]
MSATGLIEVLRADVRESEHAGSIAVVDSNGRVIAYCGDIKREIFTRSSLKPFQAAPFVAMGGLERRGWGLPQLALMCASHSGEEKHVALARSMLADCGLEHKHLLCGCQVPIAYTQSGRLPKADAVFCELHNNCSGKHSGFLAACLHQGESIDDYVAMGHPLQRRIRDSLAKALGRDQAFRLGVDGCAAPNLAMPLPALAQLFAVMAAEQSPESFAKVYGDAPQRCFAAMTQFPELVSGTDRSDLALMNIGAGDWVCKAGAEAVQAIGVRSRGLGIAIKIADGNARAMTWIVVEIFRQLGIGNNEQKKQLQALVDRPIRNVRGDAVGSYRPVFKLNMLTGE